MYKYRLLLYTTQVYLQVITLLLKTYLMMKDKCLSFLNLMHYLRSFIKGCHICQLSRSDKPLTRGVTTSILIVVL